MPYQNMLPFPGLRCEGNIDECVSNPCQNNGRCIDAANRYRCLCPDGFTGLHCETNVDECTAAPCLHGRYGFLTASISRNTANYAELFLITLLASAVSGDICHML